MLLFTFKVITPFGFFFFPFRLSFLDLFLNLLIEHPSKVGRLLAFFASRLQELGDDLNDEWPVSRVVTVIVNHAASYRRRHPIVGKDEVDPTFIGVLVGFARGFSRFALSFAFIVANVSPARFFDEGHRGGGSFDVPVEVTHDEFRSRAHGFELNFQDG